MKENKLTQTEKLREASLVKDVTFELRSKEWKDIRKENGQKHVITWKMLRLQ